MIIYTLINAETCQWWVHIKNVDFFFINKDSYCGMILTLFTLESNLQSYFALGIIYWSTHTCVFFKFVTNYFLYCSRFAAIVFLMSALRFPIDWKVNRLVTNLFTFTAAIATLCSASFVVVSSFESSWCWYFIAWWFEEKKNIIKSCWYFFSLCLKYAINYNANGEKLRKTWKPF